MRRSSPWHDEGPNAPPTDTRAEAARLRRLLSALRDVAAGEVTLSDVCGRFGLRTHDAYDIAEAHGIEGCRQRRTG